MAEQPVSDRLAAIPRYGFDALGTYMSLIGEWCRWDRVQEDITSLQKELSDYRQAALSSDAALEQADLQIGALRAEQARLRAENERLKADVQAWRNCTSASVNKWKSWE